MSAECISSVRKSAEQISRLGTDRLGQLGQPVHKVALAGTLVVVAGSLVLAHMNSCSASMNDDDDNRRKRLKPDRFR